MSTSRSPLHRLAFRALALPLCWALCVANVPAMAAASASGAGHASVARGAVGDQASTQFAPLFFIWCVFTFGEWDACWFAAGD